MDSSNSQVRTRVLLLSDTHGLHLLPENIPKSPVDVVIHCGDLTEESKLDEVRTTIQLLKNLQAPLKLVIAGNHDFTLDIPAFRQKIKYAPVPLEPELVSREYGAYGEARQILEQAAEAGIVLLDEGTHTFKLDNGALLTVYASPYTPASSSNIGPGDEWGFQYPPSQGHEFDIPSNIDIAITHGPPQGIMDRTQDKKRIGCPDLFAAIARSRPMLHCFGHVHRMDAKLVAWRQNQPKDETPSHFTAIDNSNSRGLRALQLDGQHLEPVTADMRGSNTLFVNTALQTPGEDQWLSNKPWTVQLDLPRQP